ncbi:bestrophin family protein [Kordia zhangzhouensis]|uniref:bestrophin family protein n=1 Tax=Kordia zhangzhouensis TaxID=1620405 RepID=UPI000629AAAF|nr:bestrophin family ion channel [Kordia zhangzhouensis]
MYTRRIFPIKGMLKWTRRHIYIFIILAIIPVIFYEFIGIRWLRVPWLPLGVLGTAVAFIVSFKNNASYDRLWEARKIWGGIVNASRSWTLMVKDFVTNQFATNSLADAEIKTIHRELVHRHIAWLTALRYQLRKDKPWETHLKKSKSNREFRANYYLVCEDEIPVESAVSPYISSQEMEEIFAKGNQASQLVGIQSRRLKELRTEGLIDDFRHMKMQEMLTELYTLQGKSERIKNFPYPRQFATLNYIFVWIFIILLPFGMIDGFETIGANIQALMETKHLHTMNIFVDLEKFFSDHFVWLSIPFSVLLSWVFHTMEAIGENTENPFEGGPNDVPITDMTRGIEIDIRQLIDDTDIPDPYQWRNHIVM